MEEKIDENIFQHVQMMARKKTKVWKPPTRLQKQAPASLEVGNHYSTSNNSLMPSMGAASSFHTPIPLLSPLNVSPGPTILEAEEFRFPVIDDDMDKNCEIDQGGHGSSSALGGGGWQHPAVANAYMDSSSLFKVFQSKCVIVNQGK